VWVLRRNRLMRLSVGAWQLPKVAVVKTLVVVSG
jgi:hypothetical protein